ncbi:type VII secretion protein EccCa [Cryptosporangium aurantiacum]|uniref:DNA segregation ATPase FtsK/SpoIIIE, S-DNA-T family n=1 Tax=Cryptosporangium aurantiacum TaxID=134849 RepID=A0A1M7NJD9_9ACTN|nr:type VII secretion protein EccCa [Cryptosporangium aurantiacum]SHN03399.1 DNA segregation ATPase FtsK/SpoIIIE, S-DNA-T family [Cryptosporangium aurantiacum]
MGTVIVKRPPRRPAPGFPEGEIVLETPPAIPAPTGRAWGQAMTMLPMLAGSAAMALMFAGTGGAGSTLRWVTGGLFGLSAIGMLSTQLGSYSGQPSKQEMAAQRREYMRHLAQLRRRTRKAVRTQQEAMFYRHPEPGTLWTAAQSYRLWERRPKDEDFGVVRIGLGPQDLATPMITPPIQAMDDLEPLCAQALRRFVTTYAVVADMPVALALNGFARIFLRGDADGVRAVTRALLAQVTTFHAPDDVRVVICAAPDRLAEWEWVKWLPHAQHPARTDALGPVRLVAPTVLGAEAMLDDVLAGRPRFNPTGTGQEVAPHLVVVLDGADPAGSDHLVTDNGVEGVTLIDLAGSPPRLLDPATLVLDVDRAGRLRSTTMEGDAEVGVIDRMGMAQAEALARQLAPLRLSPAVRGERPLTTDLELTELLGLDDPRLFDPTTAWRPRPNREQLRVPIGIEPGGAPVELDLKESALDGMGPHGLLIGATGSGKSELLRTLVLALATRHSSEFLNFVLVDFKGGATFTKLDRIPHTSAVITNLEDELPLVDRMSDAIAGELRRRQELLRSAGKYESLRDYEKARAAGAPLEPLPSLLIICDEFSELLSAKPDFLDMFVQIGRLGRSLGVHLLLASQKLEEGRLRGLDGHLSYRVGLRTFSSMESRVVLGVPDAYELPRAPGHGYLKSGTEEMTRFRAAYVSGVYYEGGRRSTGPGGEGAAVRTFTSAYQAPRQETEDETAMAEQPEPDEAIGESLLDILVERLQGRGVPSHQVWLPPLKEPSTLDQLLPPLAVEPGRGLTVADPALRGALRAVVGLVDRPLEQRRDLLTLDLSGGLGHAVVVGGPQSGKSTLLRSTITALALCHTPAEAQFYCLDFGGGSLAALRDLPHVGGVASRLEAGEVRRTVAELTTLLLDRERRFAREGVDGMVTYRRRRQQGDFADDPFGDVFLVVDNWLTLRNEFDELEASITDLANRGLSYGIHVLVSATRWLDLRPALRDVLGTRLELRLGEPSDSYLDRRTALNVPESTPGRGITADKFHFLGVLPRADSRAETADLADGVAKLVQDLSNAWAGPAAPPVRLLPPVVPYASLTPADATPRTAVPIGLAESDLGPVYLDFAADPHFLLFGDSESGKTGFLRQLARRITDASAPDQARLVVIDYRRTLLGVVSAEHLIGYGTSAPVTETIVNEVATVMRNRLPGPDVTPEQLRDRSWWRGPDLYVLVDDYDLVSSGSTNPLGPLLDVLAQARDIGLHLIVARRSGGASRALYESFVMRLRELGSPGLVMSGDRDEGVLLGNVRPQALPPGRGWLVTRKEGARLVQLAWLDPSE